MSPIPPVCTLAYPLYVSILEWRKHMLWLAKCCRVCVASIIHPDYYSRDKQGQTFCASYKSTLCSADKRLHGSPTDCRRWSRWSDARIFGIFICELHVGWGEPVQNTSLCILYTFGCEVSVNQYVLYGHNLTPPITTQVPQHWSCLVTNTTFPGFRKNISFD